MSIEGTANTEYASLSGKIRTFVVDKTLTVSGACADAKATGEAIAKAAMGDVDLSAIENSIKTVSDATKTAQATADSKASTETYTATVKTAWTADGGYYYQDIDIDGVLESDNPVVDILPGTDNEANEIYKNCIGGLLRITTFDNKVRVWATVALDTSFPIQLKVVR